MARATVHPDRNEWRFPVAYGLLTIAAVASWLLYTLERGAAYHGHFLDVWGFGLIGLAGTFVAASAMYLWRRHRVGWPARLSAALGLAGGSIAGLAHVLLLGEHITEPVALASTVGVVALIGTSWMVGVLTVWQAPFVWVLVIPFVTSSISSDLVRSAFDSSTCTNVSSSLFASEWRCPASDMVHTLAPGVLNAVAFFWLVVPGRTRTAAAITGALGSVGLIIPLAMFVSRDTVDVHFSLGTTSIAGDATMVGFGLWMLLLVAMIAFATAGASRASQPKRRLHGVAVLGLVAVVIALGALLGDPDAANPALVTWVMFALAVAVGGTGAYLAVAGRPSTRNRSPTHSGAGKVS